ncbi:MAG: hypothetical protein HY649_01820 [Acidobacteria bacterium]|nr:hypothetical protein [Acidobacteriota bacterium]
MTKKAIVSVISAVFMLALLGWTLHAASARQEAAFDLSKDHKVDGVVLKAGKYLLVHQSHDAEHVGDACMFFYQPPRSSERNAVAKLHCRVSSGAEAKGFTMRTTPLPDGTLQLKSVQFSGSREIHELVPVN